MPAPKTVPCPACRREAPWENNPHRPFCSERCRLTDLGNWAAERYRIPGAPAEPPPAAKDEDSDE
jgi:endogenous inhibitor of DNA gyrase (YacG/DUF329 family)